jgi:hypothetical protein
MFYKGKIGMEQGIRIEMLYNFSDENLIFKNINKLYKYDIYLKDVICNLIFKF